MNSNTQITLPNFLLVINFRHPMKIVIFRYQNRQKITKTDSNPPQANNYYSRTAPSSISWLFSHFSCVFVQGYSLFANAQWLISKNLVSRNWPSSPSTEQLHSHLANRITPICNMGCVGSVCGWRGVDSREKQNRWGWWWMWCPPPAIFMVFLNLSLKQRGNEREKGDFTYMFVVCSTCFTVRVWRPCILMTMIENAKL